MPTRPTPGTVHAGRSNARSAILPAHGGPAGVVYYKLNDIGHRLPPFQVTWDFFPQERAGLRSELMQTGR